MCMCSIKIEKVVELVVEVIEVQVVEVWNGRQSGSGGSGSIYLMSVNTAKYMSRKKRLGPNYPPKVTGEVEIQPHICLSKACVPLPPFCPTASLILHLYQASKM